MTTLPTSTPSTTTKLLLLLITWCWISSGVNVNVVRAEPELEWSSEVCAQLGQDYASFDYCAEIIFCEATTDDRALQQQHYADNHNNEQELQQKQYLRGAIIESRAMEGAAYGDLNTKHDTSTSVSGTTSTTSTDPSHANNNAQQQQQQHYKEHPALFGWRLANKSGCSWPGPLIRMKAGTSYGLFVKGASSSSSNSDSKVNLHIHGLHVSGHGNGDDIRRAVSGSDVIVYNVTLPADHMGGTFWYHSHRHGRSYSHLKGGAFGMAIVEDNLEDQIQINDDDDVDVQVQQFLKNEQRMVLANLPGLPGSFMASAASTHYSWKSNEWYRLRVLTMSIDSHMTNHNLEFLPTKNVKKDEIMDGPCETRAIAHDGVLRFRVPAEAARKYSLNGASRIDLAIRCHANAHVSVGGTVVASISVDANEASSSSTSTSPSPFRANGQAWESKRPNYLSDLRQATVSAADKWAVKVGEHDINGVSFSMEHTMCKNEYGGTGDDFRFGTVNEWEIAPTMHPFHVHMYPMQVVSPEGCDAHEYGEFYDSLSYMNDYRNPDKPPCKVRMNFVDVGGLTALHCHMPQHEDQGSLALIDVKGDHPVQPDYPRVYKCHGDGPCDEPREIKACHE
mmetsp:Transcript_24835/g.38392  ORF Transcript_24835/g.38392 Transcript_24835/m.38392 type:complete len:620 (+) Transcript_24835:56-1915(+)